MLYNYGWIPNEYHHAVLSQIGYTPLVQVIQAILAGHIRQKSSVLQILQIDCLCY